MNKKEAAAEIKGKGKLSARLEKGKTRDVVIFDDQELARYKEQREQPTHLPR
jgi:hypothetical protein